MWLALRQEVAFEFAQLVPDPSRIFYPRSHFIHTRQPRLYLERDDTGKRGMGRRWLKHRDTRAKRTARDQLDNAAVTMLRRGMSVHRVSLALKISPWKVEGIRARHHLSKKG